MDKFSFGNLRLIESHFKLNTDFRHAKNESVEISCQINISHKKEDKTINVTVSVASADKNQPFNFEAALVGTFKFSKLPPKRDLEKIVHVNCAAIIFPYVRETIADLTRRANIPPFHMEPINFVALYENQMPQPSLSKKSLSQSSAKEGKMSEPSSQRP
jgi:preprotein translocase subunit SecB